MVFQTCRCTSAEAERRVALHWIQLRGIEVWGNLLAPEKHGSLLGTWITAWATGFRRQRTALPEALLASVFFRGHKLLRAAMSQQMIWESARRWGAPLGALSCEAERKQMAGGAHPPSARPAQESAEGLDAAWHRSRSQGSCVSQGICSEAADPGPEWKGGGGGWSGCWSFDDVETGQVPIHWGVSRVLHVEFSLPCFHLLFLFLVDNPYKHSCLSRQKKFNPK